MGAGVIKGKTSHRGALRAGRTVMLALCVLAFSRAAGAAPKSIIDKADSLYERRYDTKNVYEAIGLLEAVTIAMPGDYDASWRLARIFWFLGDKAEGKERIALFERSKQFAEAAVRINGRLVDGHYWLASSYGSLAMEKGIFAMVFAIPVVRSHIEECIRIDANDARAHSLYALFLWKLPGILGGSIGRAIEEASLAVRLEPENPVFWGILGGTLEAGGRYAEARGAFQKVLSLPLRKDDPIEDEKFRREAEAAIARMEDK